jgi:hypothetical protein
MVYSERTQSGHERVNPIIRSDDSSGVLVDDGQRRLLYTMHPAVKLWLPREAAPGHP